MYEFDDFPDVLTVYEVIAILGVGKNKVYELLNSGKLHGIRVGRCWRVPKKSLFSFLEI